MSRPRKACEGMVAALLDYPAVKFRNKVQGKTLPIQWNSGQDSRVDVQTV